VQRPRDTEAGALHRAARGGPRARTPRELRSGPPLAPASVAPAEADAMDPTRLFSPEFQADPYPVYAEMRDEGPLLAVPGFESLIATRYHDVLAILRDPRFQTGFDPEFDARGGDGWAERSPTTFRLFHHTMLAKNPPDHTRLRGLVGKAFTPRRVAELRPRVEALVEDLLDAAEARGRMDLVADFAYPLPFVVIAELLGLPPADRDRLRAWSRPLAQILDGPTRQGVLDEAETAGLGLTAYLRGELERHRTRPGDDLIDALLAARAASRRSCRARSRRCSATTRRCSSPRASRRRTWRSQAARSRVTTR
jgi:cytochrome P450